MALQAVSESLGGASFGIEDPGGRSFGDDFLQHDIPVSQEVEVGSSELGLVSHAKIYCSLLWFVGKLFCPMQISDENRLHYICLTI